MFLKELPFLHQTLVGWERTPPNPQPLAFLGQKAKALLFPTPFLTPQDIGFLRRLFFFFIIFFLFKVFI